MRLRDLALVLFLATRALTGSGMALADAASEARIADLDARIEELEINEIILQSKISEVGNAANITTALRNVRADIHQDEVLIANLEPAIAAYRVSIAELQEMQRQLDDAPIITPLDLTKEGAERRAEAALERALEAGGKKIAGRTLGIASWIGDFVEYVGKGIIIDNNADRMGEQVLFEMHKLVEALDKLVELETHRSEAIRRLHALEDLQRQARANFAELATLRAERAALRSSASPARAPCKPGTAARGTGKAAAVDAKTDPKTDTEKDLPPDSLADDACRDLTGRWTLATSITLMGRRVDQPPVKAEILREGDAEASLYLAFAVGTERAADPFLRCRPAPSGATLDCERRVQPQTCPADLYVWEPVTLTLSGEPPILQGSFVQTMTMDILADPTGCTVIPFDGAGQIEVTLSQDPAEP